MTSAKVYICDSSECLQIGLTSILRETKFVVVGGAKSAEQALADIPLMYPDILVIDSRLPGINGSEFVTQILGIQPAMRILVLTDDARTEVVSDLLAAGASGYCLKGSSALQITMAISSVMEGALWLDGGLLKGLLRPETKRVSKVSSGAHSTLTQRENEVLSLCVEGLSNQQMADRLLLSLETIKSHMHHVMEKMGVKDRTQAAVKAIRGEFSLGLVPQAC